MTRPWPRLAAGIDRTSKGASLLGGVATLVMTGLISFDVLMRYFRNEPQLFVDELAGFLQIVVVFWGLAYTFRLNGHIRVDLVTTHLPGPVRAWLRVVTLAIGLTLLVVVSWVTWQSAITAYEFGRVSTVMLYPIWIPMLLIPSGLGLMALAMIGTLAHQIRVACGPPDARDEVAPTVPAR